MEKFFQKIAFSSASIVFILLIGIFFTLFSASKEAIDEFGLDFIINPIWNKQIVINNPTSKNDLQSQNIEQKEDIIIDEDDLLSEIEFF